MSRYDFIRFGGFDYTLEDFVVADYQHHAPIKAPVAV